MGRKVQHLPVNTPSTTIDVSDLPNGIYVVKISTASGVLVRKVQVVK
ncbi:MAG: T9SS type A sorting domain-containing protein [Bacteroidales bacterium]|nr:T9SS type A sorting domain-containing protein [Bacteroidales bacterium]